MVQEAQENKKNMFVRFWRKIAFGFILAILVFVGMNYGYFWAQIKLTLWPPETAPAVTGQSPTAEDLPKGEPNFLQIESLDLTVPVVYVEEQDEKAFQAGLVNGVVHYPGTVLPGQLGNCYIFGHSSDFIFAPGNYKTVFATLPRIKVGAEIKLTDAQGNLYIYQVTETHVVAASDVSWLSQGDRQERLLTLQTSYPVGTALRRFVARARLATEIK